LSHRTLIPKRCNPSQKRQGAAHTESASVAYRDYADGGAQKITSFSAKHFLYRFLLHVVPKGFVRIRHYGFLSHAKKRAALPTIRAALLCGTSAKISSSNPHSAPSCPCCGSTRWLKLSELKPIIKRLHSPPSIASPPQVY